MVNDKKLIEKYGFTADEVAELGESRRAYEDGDWPAGKTRIGRPRTLSGEVVSISFRDSAATRDALDAAASRAGQTRSDYLRALVARDLALA